MKHQFTFVSQNLLNASLWRKFLAFRVFMLCGISMTLSFFSASFFLLDLVVWFESIKYEKLGRIIVFILVSLSIPSYYTVLKDGISDLIIHFVRQDWFRRLLLWGEVRSAETIATEFSSDGYWISLTTFIFPIGLAILTFVRYHIII